MINKYLTQGQSRRELLAGLLRYVVLGLLTVVAYLVSIRERRLLREGRCVKNGICSNCGVFESCMMPQALSMKQSLTGIKSD